MADTRRGRCIVKADRSVLTSLHSRLHCLTTADSIVWQLRCDSTVLCNETTLYQHLTDRLAVIVNQRHRHRLAALPSVVG
jgi:hypothetical protein